MAATRTLTVTSPIATDTFERFGSMKIDWTLTGKKWQNIKVRIWLVNVATSEEEEITTDGSVTSMRIKEPTKTGTWTWVGIPQWVTPGTYRLHIKWIKNNKVKEDYGTFPSASTAFTIAADVVTRIITFTTPALPVLSTIFTQGVSGNIVIVNVSNSYIGVFKLDFYVRIFGAKTWTLIQSAVDPSTTLSFAWEPDPALPANNYEVGAIETDKDASNDKNFYISPALVLAARSLTITAPIVSDVLVSDATTQTKNITWDRTGYALTAYDNEVTLRYRFIDPNDGAQEWVEIATAVDGNLGTYTWTIPATLTEGKYQVDITDAFDISDASAEFSIIKKLLTITAPALQDVLADATAMNITWTYQGYLSSETVVVQYQAIAGGGWIDISGGADSDNLSIDTKTLSWTTPALVSAAAYQVRIRVKESEVFTDDYNSDIFSITDSLADFNALEYKSILVAVSDDEVWYEKSDRTMTQAAATEGYLAGDLKPVVQVAMVPAFGKVYFADGRYQKFWKMDFKNIRITSTDNITFVQGERLTQVGGAAGIFDERIGNDYFLQQTTSTPFVKTLDTTGAINGPLTAGNTSAVDNGPFWLTWTATVGSLPHSASIGAFYRASIWLAGDVSAPHQWYKSRQGVISDFLYGQNDAQTAVSGTEADAGEAGDIVTALIPYHDDYLIIGFVNQIDVMRGDPASGGSFHNLTRTDGVFSANAWAFDDSDNLWYFGNGGLYVMAYQKRPELFTADTLPNIMAGIDRSTHIINVAYDRKRRGLNISFVNIVQGLTFGTGSAWFLDLTTGGFFPEAYPGGMVPFTSYDYSAEDKNYNELLFGWPDGYIRSFDDTRKDDDGTNGDEAIDSQVLIPPRAYAGPDEETLLQKLLITTGGMVSSDTVDYGIVVARTAAEVITKAKAYQYNISATITDTTRQIEIQRVANVYIGIMFRNNQATETFSIEEIEGDIVDAGRVLV